MFKFNRKHTKINEIPLWGDLGVSRDWTRLDETERDWTGLDWTGLDGTGRDGTGRDWTGRDWTGRDWTGRDGTGRDGTGRDKNVRIPSHRASQKLSRRSFGSKFNFGMSILYFYMDFHGFPWISIDLHTKTAEYRATRHEIKNFLYQAIDLFKPRRLKYARVSETPK